MGQIGQFGQFLKLSGQLYKIDSTKGLFAIDLNSKGSFCILHLFKLQGIIVI